jgi:uncharacterized protein YciI
MPLFTLTCMDRSDSLALRQATRPAHLDYIAANGHLVRLAGPLLDGEARPIGSHLILECADLAAAEAFAAGDPYALAGLFADTRLNAFSISIGGMSPT